jgi:EAL domain-containing protein (putative c-di-GMP-specific phosphodiesterase class I)/CheY-like chemotaxis protein
MTSPEGTVAGPGIEAASVAAPVGWSRDLVRAADPFASAVVLVVDDNEANVLLLERILGGVGVGRVHSVMDPRQVVDRCLELDPDLLLLDLHMPHLDGFGVLAALQAALPGDTFLPVIVLTGDSTSQTRERALDAGATDFLTKPFDRLEVVQRARNLLRTRALYRAIQRQNLHLQDEVDRRADAERREEAARAERRDDIRAVLDGGVLHMVFQPISHLATGSTVGVEALARFRTEPSRPPDVWFADAEDVGLGAELELAAVRAALARVPELPAGTFMSVNASPATAMEPEMLDLMASDAIGPRVVLELTEHSRVADWPALVRKLDDLRRQGVRIAVDDAGAGYAGLQQIVSLRPDVIKLDIHLTRGIDEDPVRRAMAASLVAFALETDVTIVAEGIETHAELDTLRRLDVTWGQGYLLGRPGPLPARDSRG